MSNQDLNPGPLDESSRCYHSATEIKLGGHFSPAGGVKVKICTGPIPKAEIDPECVINPVKEEKKSEIKEKVTEAKTDKQLVKEELDEEITIAPLITQNYDESKVVIIGAGMAGLAAAKYLQENNINNYVILEALGRPGGRIHSEWIGDTIVELGARSSKPPSDSSAFLQHAIADGFFQPPFTHTCIFQTCDGHSINPAISLSAYEAFKRIQLESLEIESDASDFINFRIEQELTNFPDHVQGDASRVMIGLLAMLHRTNGENLPFITRYRDTNYLQSPGGNIKVPLGFYGIIQQMLDKIPDHKIKLNTPVQNIRWGAVVCKDIPRALVKCCDGTVYPADYVITTVSLGVLKACNDTLFCPALPAEKVDAMRILEFNHLNQIYFKLSEPFWSWSTKTIDISLKKKNQCFDDWTKGITSIKQVVGSESLLRVTVTGKEAISVEKKDPSKLIDAVMEIIKGELKIMCIPTMVCCIRSRWSSNAYFNGAYSSLPPEADEEIQEKLSAPLPGSNAPVPPILFFAGEATCPKLFGTVQGAKISGIREASRIKRLITSSS
ncbi:protein anon-37Cs-like [Lycorma delicatula]|uniref:protein anon-37Cs-like n=1 Tax=Lycorma delicatula TaxID=130591 RepID=UPI003F51714D